ncbi:hypothetical protein HNP03_001420 [Pseudomonas rhodesiae]|nr:hypothetical protein [Pseudomonas rhodesiae]
MRVYLCIYPDVKISPISFPKLMSFPPSRASTSTVTTPNYALKSPCSTVNPDSRHPSGET